MAVAVQLDPVAGGDGLSKQRRTLHHLLAGEEEGGRCGRLAQGLEDGRRALRVRAVVEGEGDALGTVLAQQDRERVPDRRHHRGQRRARVGDGSCGEAGPGDRGDQGAGFAASWWLTGSAVAEDGWATAW